MGRCKNLFQVYLILLSDVIVTLNLFIFIFSFFVFLYVSYIITLNVNSNRHDGVLVVARLMKEGSRIPGSNNTFRIMSRLVDEDSETSYELMSGLIRTNLDSVDPTEIIFIGEYQLPRNVEGVDLTEIIGEYRQVTYEIEGRTYTKDVANRIVSSRPSVEYVVKANYIPPKKSTYHPWSLYALIYTRIDELETAFLEQIKPSFNVVELRRIIAPNPFGFYPNFDTLYCKYPGPSGYNGNVLALRTD
jgi:hypothetical protein